MHITLCVKHVVTKKRECLYLTRYPEMSGIKLFEFMVQNFLEYYTKAIKENFIGL